MHLVPDPESRAEFNAGSGSSCGFQAYPWGMECGSRLCSTLAPGCHGVPMSPMRNPTPSPDSRTGSGIPWEATHENTDTRGMPGGSQAVNARKEILSEMELQKKAPNGDPLTAKNTVAELKATGPMLIEAHTCITLAKSFLTTRSKPNPLPQWGNL